MYSALLIVDRIIPYPHSGREVNSLLTLPMNTSTILEYLISQINCAGRSNSPLVRDVLIKPAFSYGPDYVDHVNKNIKIVVDIVSSETLAETMDKYETSDNILIVDPIHWPISGYRFSEIRGLPSDYHGVTHIISVGTNLDDTRELVECDISGRVKRIQRLYNIKNWPEAARECIICSIIPACILKKVHFTCLTELRTQLTNRGILSRDVPLKSGMIDLISEMGYLTINEHVMTDTTWKQNKLKTCKRSQEVIVSHGCRIDRSSCLIPPIIIQSNATIHENATIIGPAIIGECSRIEKNAVVVQSVLDKNTIVSSGQTIRHRVVANTCSHSMNDKDFPIQPYPSCRQSMTAYGCPDFMNESMLQIESKRRRIHLAAKRFMDIGLSLAGLIILSPLLILVSVLIKLTSPGSILFAHQREQRNGKEFPCWKFRTMVMDAHYQQKKLYANNEVDGPQFKLDNDPRVTTLGRWLRRTNIDELPQLINVILGQMSLVGPRPSPFRENQICIPWRKARLSVRPGITGLWQICRDRCSNADFHQWIYYDINYVRHFSIWLDIKILTATVFTLGGKWSVPISWFIRNTERTSRHLHQYDAA